jgi:hypothetical protein
MTSNASLLIYALLAFAAVLMTLLGALTCIDAARKGHRQLGSVARDAHAGDQLMSRAPALETGE